MQVLDVVAVEIRNLNNIAIVDNKPFLHNAIQAVESGADLVYLLKVINTMENVMIEHRNELIQVMNTRGSVVLHGKP